MQTFASAWRERQRPCAPSDCPRCGGKQKLHRHGSFQRFAEPSGQTKRRVERFVCPRCRLTLSVIPEDMLPYRSLGVQRLETWMDNPSRSPPSCKIEQGCLLRAYHRLGQRIPVLCQLLGQQLPSRFHGSLCVFWQALRKIATLPDILLELASNFKTSLLADYRSFQPPWAREMSPV